ncbi:hypothetical protein POM88_051252 [Heracleum sosnowskyi]|uniref:Uncharacterized protein n=1 Tax=Heracleum sosnowskyi TaxID=360622 RepID=A0AAD8H060_9APIA|nr:hypothetical protein POM88_051252 [Heracleum sosnowskyi]
MLSSMCTITKTCKVVPKIITKVRLDFQDGISIWWHPLLAGSLRLLCTSQTEDKYVPCKNLAQTKKEQGWCYDPTIKYEALRQCAVPRPAYYAESATDWNDSSDSEIEIETMTEEEAQVKKDKIIAEAKEEQPFPNYPHINYGILKQFWYLDSPDSLAYSNLILGSDPKEELQAKLDKFFCEATLKQVYCNTNDTKTGVRILADTETEPETKTETMAEEEAHKNKNLAGAKDEHLFCYEPNIKYEPLKRYIVPRFAFFDSSSTDWSDSSSFSDSETETETETETMAKKEA